MSKKYAIKLGKNIAVARKRRNLTQSELSGISGVEYNTLIKIEGGKIENPRAKTLENLARALRVAVDSLTPYVETYSPITSTSGFLSDMPFASYGEISELVDSIPTLPLDFPKLGPPNWRIS